LTGLHHWNPRKFSILTIKSFVNHKDFLLADLQMRYEYY